MTEQTHLMNSVQHARGPNSPSTDPPDNTPSNERTGDDEDYKSTMPAPIDPPDNVSLPSDPSVTRPDY